jgi:hypothetical protein
MKRYLKFPAESKLGIGTQYVELDSDGWAVRQVECYGNRWFSSDRDDLVEVGGIALCDQQFLDEDIQAEDIIDRSEFELIWDRSVSGFVQTKSGS